MLSSLNLPLCTLSNYAAFQTMLPTQGKCGTCLVFPYHEDDLLTIQSLPYSNCLIQCFAHSVLLRMDMKQGAQAGQKPGNKEWATWNSKSFSSAQHNQQTTLKSYVNRQFCLLALTINRWKTPNFNLKGERKCG